ncbi:efflux RND transporter permease subunit, partial [Acinetobacter baumannii]|uniref:efflux RND transporter permease subunit n=1 Tax=Acinetobacter baumannii TaxID=470 RepID=UPI001146DCF9
FAPLGLADVLAIVASLVVALTSTPALCMLLLGRAGKRRKTERDPPITHWLRRLYAALLRRIARFQRLTLLTSVVLAAGALTLL